MAVRKSLRQATKLKKMTLKLPSSATLPASSTPAPPPKLVAFLLLCVVVAAWIDFGDFHRLHTADSLVPVLISLQRWTPFMWFQDRLGMLVPLAAMPLRDPFTNLLFQQACCIASALAAMFLLARWTLRDVSYPIVATVGAASFLTLAPASYRFDFFSNALHGVWLVLGFGGLVLAMPGRLGVTWTRRTGALLLLMLTHWAYLPAIVLLGPLVVFRACLFPEMLRSTSGRDGVQPKFSLLNRCKRWLLDTEAGWSLVCLVTAFIAGTALMRSVPTPHTPFRLIEVREWPFAWWQFACNTWRALSPAYWPSVLLGAAVIGCLFMAVPAVRRQASASWRAALALTGGGLVFAMVVGACQWLARQDYHDRYSKPAVFVWQAALCALAIGPVAVVAPRKVRLFLYAFAAPVLLSAAYVSYGTPSLARVHTDLEEACGPYTPDIVAAGCTHVAGDYWKIWPAVFHANMVLHERGEARVVWGVSFRSQAVRAQCRSTPIEALRVATPIGDTEASDLLEVFAFPPLKLAQKRATIDVWRAETAKGRR